MLLGDGKILECQWHRQAGEKATAACEWSTH